MVSNYKEMRKQKYMRTSGIEIKQKIINEEAENEATNPFHIATFYRCDAIVAMMQLRVIKGQMEK